MCYLAIRALTGPKAEVSSGQPGAIIVAAMPCQPTAGWQACSISCKPGCAGPLTMINISRNNINTVVLLILILLILLLLF